MTFKGEYKNIGKVNCSNVEKESKLYDKLMLKNKKLKRVINAFTRYIHKYQSLQSILIELDSDNCNKLEKIIKKYNFNISTNKEMIKKNKNDMFKFHNLTSYNRTQSQLFKECKEPDFRLDERIIKSVHASLLSNIPNNQMIAPGHFRGEGITYNNSKYDDVIIPGARFPITKGEDVNLEINIFIYNFNETWKDYSPIDKAAIVHSEFIRIHPFKDGNGRTARMLSNMVLVQNGYPVYSIRTADREEYIEVLGNTICNQDIQPFSNYIKNKLEKQLCVYRDFINIEFNNNPEYTSLIKSYKEEIKKEFVIDCDEEYSQS